jgi:nitrogen-specific signal transduction histidine kinase
VLRLSIDIADNDGVPGDLQHLVVWWFVDHVNGGPGLGLLGPKFLSDVEKMKGCLAAWGRP